MNIEDINKKLDEISNKLSLIQPKKKRVITKEPSEKQLAQRQKFKELVQSKKKLDESKTEIKPEESSNKKSKNKKNKIKSNNI